MKLNLIIKGIIGLLLVYFVLYVGLWEFGFCRVYVNENEILVVQQKMFGKENKSGDALVPVGTKGVWKRVFVTGRYFFNPLIYHVEKHKITKIDVVRSRYGEFLNAKIGIVTAKSGDKLPQGEFLANKNQRGIWRQVLTPGKYALNPKGYVVKTSFLTSIPTGYVGCVTTLSGTQPESGELAKSNEKGIQKNVLNPGLYPINPYAKKVDIVEVGYNLLDLKKVAFPSSDGFNIKLDMSVVWGLEPKNVPYIISQFGNTSEVVNKIISPQVTSICMLEGSELGAKQFIEGKTREEFQNSFTNKLKNVCETKKTNVQICLVRDIDVPSNIKDPIQQAYINLELKLTKDVQKDTQKVKAQLQSLIADVEKGRAEVKAETDRLVQNIKANGDREVAKISADAEIKIAEINRKIAETDAKAELIIGKAKAESAEMIGKAKSNKFKQFVKAFGTPDSYLNWTFANSLPWGMKLNLRYSGDGTLWTDIKNNDLNIAAMKYLSNNTSKIKKTKRKKKYKNYYNYYNLKSARQNLKY